MKILGNRLTSTCIFFTLLIACSSSEENALEGPGTLVLNITPPPATTVMVNVKGPAGYNQNFSTSQLLEDLPAGTYQVRAGIERIADDMIDLAYRPDQLNQTAIINNNEQTVNVIYELMPGSGKLWFGNQNATAGQQVIAFDREQLGSAGNKNASVNLTGSVGTPRGIAFDPMGNLWVADGTGSVKRFDWKSLGGSNVSGNKSLSINNPFFITFDADTNLWVTSPSTLTRFPKETVLSNQSNADIIINSPIFDGLRDLVFDANGDLWIANSGADNVIKINAADLVTGGSVAPAVAITSQSTPPVVLELSSPTSLALDASNNFWVGYFGPNILARLTPENRVSTQTFEPAIQIELPVSVLVESMVFDNGENLWLPYGSGQFARITSSQLSGAGNANVFTSSQANFLSGSAIFPPKN